MITMVSMILFAVTTALLIILGLALMSKQYTLNFLPTLYLSIVWLSTGIYNFGLW
jgi:hypothetical protein